MIELVLATALLGQVSCPTCQQPQQPQIQYAPQAQIITQYVPQTTYVPRSYAVTPEVNFRQGFLFPNLFWRSVRYRVIPVAPVSPTGLR